MKQYKGSYSTRIKFLIYKGQVEGKRLLKLKFERLRHIRHIYY